MDPPTAAALYVNEEGDFKVRRDLAVPEPQEGEITVNTLFSGVNPADIHHAKQLGIRSTILGYDFCGEIVDANHSSIYTAGDIVAGYTPTGVGRPPRYGTHQQYLACPEDMLFRVSKDLPQEHAACMTVVTSTAADALFNLFGFPLPSEKPVEGLQAKPLLVWGGSTSVGLCVLQFARAVGISPIFTTTSTGRHELLQSLGATKCFDYSSPDVAAQIKAAEKEAGKGPIAYAIDCAGSSSSAEKMKQCVSETTPLVSVAIRSDSRFRMPFAIANAPAELQPEGGPRVHLPARQEHARRMRKALIWAVENYNRGFSLPAVEVFTGSGEEAIKKLEEVAQCRHFGKVAIQHPLQ